MIVPAAEQEKDLLIEHSRDARPSARALEYAKELEVILETTNKEFNEQSAFAR